MGVLVCVFTDAATVTSASAVLVGVLEGDSVAVDVFEGTGVLLGTGVAVNVSVFSGVAENSVLVAIGVAVGECIAGKTAMDVGDAAGVRVSNTSVAVGVSNKIAGSGIKGNT